MPRNTLFDQQQNYKSDPQDKLKRRPIHHVKEHLDKGLYPAIPVEDEEDNLNEEQYEENELNHTDEVLGKAKLQSVRNKKLSETDKKTQKEKEVTFRKKHSSDLPNAKSIPFYKNYFSYFIYLFLIMFIGYFGLLRSSVSKTELSLNEKLKNMQDIFQDQKFVTFRILEKALDKVVNVTMKPSAPAIFTVIVNKNAVYKSHTFLHHLAKVLAPQSTVLINESRPWHNDPNDIKFKIDDEIQSIAKKNDFFVVIVDNLHNIPLKGAMIFHSYCDHEAAPFKQAVFLFIVPLNETLHKDTPIKKVDEAAFQQLKYIWNNASPDEIDSLITRITVNVINIV